MRKKLQLDSKMVIFGKFYMKQSEMNNYVVYNGVTDESNLIDSSVNFMFLIVKMLVDYDKKIKIAVNVHKNYNDALYKMC